MGNTLKSYGGKTDKGLVFTLSELKGYFLLIYFKTPKNKTKKSPCFFYLNEEIENTFLWEEVKNKNIIINNNLAFADSYGVKYNNDLQFLHNTLFVTDKNKVITHIIYRHLRRQNH